MPQGGRRGTSLPLTSLREVDRRPAESGWMATTGGRPARAVVTAAVVALTAALSAGGVGYEIGMQHSRIGAVVEGLKAAAAGPCPVGNTTPDASATSPAGAAVLARLLPVPPGAKQLPDVKQGVLSLSDFLNEVYPGNRTEQLVLTDHCFQTAVNRTWQTPGGSAIEVWLIQFGTADDARSYTLSTEQTDASDAANTDKFAITTVGDGMGIGRPALDKFGNTLMRLLGDTGNISMIIHIYAPARLENAAAARVLQAQNARLSPASS
jgi:hypothetical protein